MVSALSPYITVSGSGRYHAVTDVRVPWVAACVGCARRDVAKGPYETWHDRKPPCMPRNPASTDRRSLAGFVDPPRVRPAPGQGRRGKAARAELPSGRSQSAAPKVCPYLRCCPCLADSSVLACICSCTLSPIVQCRPRGDSSVAATTDQQSATEAPSALQELMPRCSRMTPAQAPGSSAIHPYHPALSSGIPLQASGAPRVAQRARAAMRPRRRSRGGHSVAEPIPQGCSVQSAERVPDAEAASRHCQCPEWRRACAGCWHGARYCLTSRQAHRLDAVRLSAPHARQHVRNDREPSQRPLLSIMITCV